MLTLTDQEMTGTKILPSLSIIGKGHEFVIVLDKYMNRFEFHGISIPADAADLYSPVIKWFNTYKNFPNVKTEVIFKMDYICHESSEMIQKILDILQILHLKGNFVSAKWYYHFDDEDIRMEGRHFSNIFSFPFELINYKS